MNNQNLLELNWGTQAPLMFNDAKCGQLEVLCNGSCRYVVNNANANLELVAGNLYQSIISSASQVINEMSGVDFEQLTTDMPGKLSSTFLSNYQSSDISVTEFKITSIKLTDSSSQKRLGMMNQSVGSPAQVQAGPTIVQTDTGANDGQNKCPSCGSTEISLNVNTGKLKCRYCRCEFEPEKISELDGDVSQLVGNVVGSGATDIVADTNDVLTFKCSSCGAEVVIDTASSVQARCHWCRSTLSVNQQIPNGSIPDVVLPFAIKKEDAKLDIENFVNKRKFFAHPKFTKEFTTDNIMGVYFPYMLVDFNSHVSLAGQGEKLIRRYTRGSGDNERTYYDADLYSVTRDFDLAIDDLTVESSNDRLNNAKADKTNNVINAVMPFDTENCVKWNANYLKGYTSEKRDINIEQLRPLVELQAQDIARHSANETISFYDRGVAWSSEQMVVKGQMWKSAYLPVWLYSYQQVNGDKSVLHYVAVNARTRETMGSIPIHIPKLLLFSFLIEIIGVVMFLFVEDDFRYAFLSLGFIFFMIMFLRYRNSNARHKHEKDTKTKISSLVETNDFIKHMKGLSNSRMQGANNNKVSGKTNSSAVLNALNMENMNNSVRNAIVNNNSVQNMINDNNNNNNN